MKSFLIALSLVASFSTFAQANLGARCEAINGAYYRCYVCNNVYPRALYCRLEAQGQTASGFIGRFFNQGWVAPGQCMYVNVQANNPWVDPLVNAYANANCRF